ncbi:MAG: hypothetical protein U0838_01150 [Chloroflexota bacterium]
MTTTPTTPAATAAARRRALVRSFWLLPLRAPGHRRPVRPGAAEGAQARVRDAPPRHHRAPQQAPDPAIIGYYPDGANLA